MADNIYEIIDYDEEKNDTVAANYGHQAFTIIPVEDAIIMKAIDADEKAFEKLFMGTYRYVFAAIRKYLKNEQDIYDAIQDTYTRVYKGISRLESASSFYPWLYRVAVNCAKDILNTNRQNISVPLENETIPSNESSTENADICADVSEVLKQLPPEQSELLIRVYYDKMRVAEIARMQGVPVTTVHNRLKSAKKNLKELLKIRGIDNPLYGGELVSVVATAIRNIIGTELLSLAVAEEILHNVTKSADKKGAFVVATFARKMRNRAAKRIANALVLVSVVLITVVLIAATVFINGGEALKNNSSEAGGRNEGSLTDDGINSNASSSFIQGGSNMEFSSSTNKQSSTVDSSSEDKPSSETTSADGTSSKYDFFPMTPETDISMTGLLADEGDFGTFSENGKLPIAATKDAIYAVSNGALVSVKKNSTNNITVHCNNFGRLYTEKSSFLNVYDGRVYWIDTEGDSRFVLNRTNRDGSGHYSVVFEEEKCTYLTKMLVTEEGVYFTAGIHGNFEHRESGTLYRTDFDFNIINKKKGIADYAIAGGKLYYIEGKYNYGDIYYADKISLEKSGSVFTDHLHHGSLYTFGDYLVASRDNLYGHTEGGNSSGYRIIDTRTNETVRRVDGEGAYIEILDASGYNGGTLVYRWGNELLVLNIESGEIRDYTSPLGVTVGDFKYYLDPYTQDFMMYNIKNNKKYSLH